jgi:hypothetical protein
MIPLGQQPLVLVTAPSKGRADRDHDIDIALGQFLRERGDALWIALGRPREEFNIIRLSISRRL